MKLMLMWSHKKKLCTLRWSTFQSRHVTRQPQPEHLQNGMAWLWKREPKGKPFLLIPCKGQMAALVTMSSWGLTPFCWKNCLELHFFYHYLSKKLVEAILVSLVVSVPWSGERWGWTEWHNRKGGEEGVLRQTRGGCCRWVGRWSGLQQ